MRRATDRRPLPRPCALTFAFSLSLWAGCAGQVPALDASAPPHDLNRGATFGDVGATPADGPPVAEGPASDLRPARRDPIDAAPPLPPPIRVCAPYCDTIADCGPLAVTCEDKICKVCASDGDCPAGAQRCHRASGLCIMCDDDFDCQAPQLLWSGKCDPALKLCVRCDDVYDCAWPGSTTPLCLNNRCVACNSDLDCALAPRTGCDAAGFCSRCRADAECCVAGQPSCALRCELATGICTCQDAQQCADSFGAGKWTCERPRLGAAAPADLRHLR